MFNPEDLLSQIKGIAPKFLLKLKKLGIHTVRDLLWHFPSRYEDFSEICNINDIQPGQQVTIQGTIISVHSRESWHKRMTIVEAEISDENNDVIRAVWFNQPYLRNTLRPGRYANFAGKISSSDEEELFLSNPTYEFVSPRKNDTDDFSESSNDYVESPVPKHTGRIVPIYPETRGLTSKGIRFLVSQVLGQFSAEDFLPPAVLSSCNLPDISSALRNIHFPEAVEDALQARTRFAFENLFLLHLSNIRQKNALLEERAPAIRLDTEFLATCLARLPFELTPTQTKSLEEILKDIGRPTPMNRLLQGDVGSGKTVVTILAALQTAKNNLQTAFMAPTEILAQQHFHTFKKLFGRSETSIGLLTSGSAEICYGTNLEGKIKKTDLLREIKENKIKIVVGTHALIQKNVEFANLGLIAIDEQHRFGVSQRATLANSHKQGAHQAKSGYVPHFLSMSATPIPRTLMLAVFGDLDISLIEGVPHGRKPIITKIVSPQHRRTAYGFVKGELQKGRQAFVICPRIEISDAAGDALAMEIKTVKEEYEKLSQKIFPEFRVAMLHGKMKPGEKETVMKQFHEGAIDILVSTSVIEVGVDVPNASVMMIEGAERFGLAQLYQFRGRIGRGAHQSFCLLFSNSSSLPPQKRLKALLEAKNGFELAEQDLALRGPGEFIGKKQTGTPDFLMRSLDNVAVIKESRDAALLVLENDPQLLQSPLLKKRLDAFQKAIHLE